MIHPLVCFYNQTPRTICSLHSVSHCPPDSHFHASCLDAHQHSTVSKGSKQFEGPPQAPLQMNRHSVWREKNDPSVCVCGSYLAVAQKDKTRVPPVKDYIKSKCKQMLELCNPVVFSLRLMQSWEFPFGLVSIMLIRRHEMTILRREKQNTVIRSELHAVCSLSQGPPRGPGHPVWGFWQTKPRSHSFPSRAALSCIPENWK